MRCSVAPSSHITKLKMIQTKVKHHIYLSKHLCVLQFFKIGLPNESTMESKPQQTRVYDRAKEHFLKDFPNSLPIEQAYVHIGMFLGWMIEQQLCSEFFIEECETQMYRFGKREISCTVLSEIWDGYLGSDLFTDEGNMFCFYYYGGGLYKKDYELTLGKETPTIYHVEDTWTNYAEICKVISLRYADWKRLIS